MRARDFTDFLQYVVVRTFLGFTGILPQRTAAGFGRLLGRVYFLLGRKMKEGVFRNMRTAFGEEKTGEEMLDIAKAFYGNIGLFIMEFARLPRLDRSYVDRFITFEGLENIDRALKRGHGVVLLSAHFGNWELLGAALSLKGYRLNNIARPFDNRYVNTFIDKARSRFGNTIIDKKHSLRKMIDILKQNGFLGILLDQRSSRGEGVRVDFFGRPALTNKGLAAVVMRTGAVVLPIFIVRGDTFEHRVICEGPIGVVNTGDQDLDIRENTQRFTAAIERFIRKYPDQWFWFHSRWERRRKKRYV
jgi:KDO2-lipid IV(A) lauroyltransferase